MDKNETTQIDFEKAISRLEEITLALEKDNGRLEDSLALFEEGIGLVRSCTAQLDEAEQKVKLLINNGNGEYDERELTTNK